MRTPLDNAHEEASRFLHFDTFVLRMWASRPFRPAARRMVECHDLCINDLHDKRASEGPGAACSQSVSKAAVVAADVVVGLLCMPLCMRGRRESQ